MNNLEYLFTHDRERILRNLTMEEDPCYICPKYDATNPDVCDSGRCTEVMREWLTAEHVDETDGISANDPLVEPCTFQGEKVQGCVDELPEGDVVAILRKWANFWGVSHSTHTQCDSDWEVTTMRALADMVERDYVRRDDYDFMADALKYMKAERDEWKRKAAEEKSNAEGHWRNANNIAKERDEWRAKAEAKSADCVRDGGEMSENDVRTDDVGANDGIISTMPLKMPSEIKVQYVDDESCNQVADQREHAETPHASKWQSNDAQKVIPDAEKYKLESNSEGVSHTEDSREKLEADVLVNFGDGLVRSIIMRLLERQAAITEREIEKKWSSFSDSVDGHITELSREIGTLRAERDRYRELCGKLLDAADEMRRVRDQFDAFTEVDR